MCIQNFVLPGLEVHAKKEAKVKQNIINAASKVMLEKGFASSNINEIASEAGLTEPTIYKYFMGKEELLFSVVEQQLEDSFAFINEHLQGINGTYEKLRKLVWAHLRYNDLHREYMILLFYECRSNRNFYKSRAYELLRQYSGNYLYLLEEGMQRGIFRPTVNIRLIRDIILGLLDYEAYTVVVTKEILEAVLDHETIMGLVERMLIIKEDNDNSSLSKKPRILRSAVMLFAKKGYAETTISEIARMAGVSNGSIYEYFKNKEDILLSIPEERFERQLQQLEETFNIRSTERKLRRFIQDHFRLYSDDYDFLIVYLVLIELNRRFHKTRAYDTLSSYMKVFEELVQEGIDEGSFSSDCNVRVFRNMFLGAFTHINLRWFLAPGKGNVDKFGEINTATNLLLDAIRARS